MNNNQNLLIFIPGFKGSTLVNNEKSLIWPNFMHAQFNHRTTLDFNIQSSNKMIVQKYHSDSVVQSVSLIPKVLSYDIYGKFIRQIQKQLPKNSTLLCYHYDWRQDLAISTNRLKAKIEKHAQYHNGYIDIICHSMGGLIAAYLLKTLDVNTIRKIFFVGTPFKGASKVLLDLEYGSKLGMNKSLLSPYAIGTFPSIYYLLPQDLEFTSGQDLFDIQTWKKFSIGYYAKTEKNFYFLERQLQKAKKFYQELNTIKHHNNIQKTELHFIKSVMFSTPTKLTFTPTIKADSALGDGTVPEKSLMVPKYLQSFNYNTAKINKIHAESFKSKELIDILLKNLL